MSLAIYSAQSSEASKLRKGDFEIYYNEEEGLVYIKTGRDDVRFNVLYNKEEVDQLISQGVDPTSFENWIFNAHKIYSFNTGNLVTVTTIAGLLEYLAGDMQALRMLMTLKIDTSAMINYIPNDPPAPGKLYLAASLYSYLNKMLSQDDLIQWSDETRPQNTTSIYTAQSLWDKINSIAGLIKYDPEVQPQANKIYEALSLYPYLNKMIVTDDLVQWSDDVRPQNTTSIYTAQSLWDKITSIVECTCDPDVMAFMTQLYNMSIIQDSGDPVTLPHLYIRSNVHAHGVFTCVNYPIRASYEKRPDMPLTDEVEYIEDSSNDYEPFDPDKPVYGTYTLPCCLTLNGTIMLLNSQWNYQWNPYRRHTYKGRH